MAITRLAVLLDRSISSLPRHLLSGREDYKAEWEEVDKKGTRSNGLTTSIKVNYNLKWYWHS